MASREQLERSEAAILQIFNNQFPVVTKQVIENLHEISKASQMWPSVLLVILGAVLLSSSMLMRAQYFLGDRVPKLEPREFIALVIAAAGLMLAGSLFSLIQARGWRKIAEMQQAVGMEILHKQIDIERDVLMGKQRQQPGGALILFPTKIRRRFRR
jgi:ABC-type multidrug transport system fused ATPase/permease subunit